MNSTGFTFGTTTSNIQPALTTAAPTTAPSSLHQSNPFSFQPSQQPRQDATLGPSPSSPSTHPFQYIQECLDPSSSNFRFRFFFYNPVPGGMISNTQSRPSFVSDRLWNQVVNDNPDPTKMVPVLANGFSDLTSRRAWQDENLLAQRTKLTELENRLVNLLTRQDLDVTTQIQVIQKQQLKLTLRILHLMKKAEVLRKSGMKLSSAEQELLGRIQSLVQKIQQTPVNNAGVRNLEQQLQALMEAGRLDPFTSARQCALTDEGSKETLYNLLQIQQKGISALIDNINKNSRDLDIMRHGFST